MKIIDLLVKIANGLPLPIQINVYGMIFYYEEPFGQYKNKYCQELIKYLHGDYDNNCGLTYKAILNTVVDYVEDEDEQ